MKKLISLQLEEELISRAKAYAKSVGATLSGIIRVSLEKYLEVHHE